MKSTGSPRMGHKSPFHTSRERNNLCKLEDNYATMNRDKYSRLEREEGLKTNIPRKPLLIVRSLFGAVPRTLINCIFSSLSLENDQHQG
ncbi:hypothetical protein CEXT_772501 [Caerostris extrusa]|uniref:Uncharacterized protein n=1 Tax=Caerostris extrusa TaxID=172846 RepID=A0AAV4SGS6_CAEEX|nr:hypothetical protein CEXT_772501 [Caerostris extrusa]